MNRRKLSTVGAFSASALLWFDTATADPDWGYVQAITQNVVMNAQAYCAGSYEGHDYMNCLYGYVQQSAGMWYGIGSAALAQADYCTQYLIYPCTTTMLGTEMTYYQVAETAAYISAILYGLVSS